MSRYWKTRDRRVAQGFVRLLGPGRRQCANHRRMLRALERKVLEGKTDEELREIEAVIIALKSESSSVH